MSMGRPAIDRQLCKGCELCVTTCPENILAMSEDLNDIGLPYVYCCDVDRCTGCTLCAIICPEPAIEVWRLS